MLETIEAIYENGTFKPLQPVHLPEGTTVQINLPSEASPAPETPVAPGIVRRRDRGLCVAGTKLSLFTLLDYVKAGQQQDLLTFGELRAAQLQQALEYIAAHQAEFDLAYAEYRQKANELESFYRNRPSRPSSHNFTPEQAAIRERLQTRQQQRETR